MSSHRPTILVVDDDPVARAVSSELVELFGYRVATAHCGADTLRLLDEHRFDALVVACDPADEGGYEFIRRLRELEGERPRTPVVAVTSTGDEEARRRCLLAGADDHLARPLDGEALAACLGQHVAAAPILDEHMVLTLRRLNLTASLYPAFIAALPGQVEALRAAIAAEDRPRIRQLAHRLRGSAAQMGAAALAQALQLIEAAAKGPEARPVAPPGADFDALVATTTAALRAELDAGG